MYLHPDVRTFDAEFDQDYLRPMFNTLAPSHLRAADDLIASQIFDDERYLTCDTVPLCIARERDHEEGTCSRPLHHEDVAA